MKSTNEATRGGVIGTAADSATAARRLSVLIVSGDRRFRSRLQTGLGRYFALVEGVADEKRARQVCKRCHFDYVLVDDAPGHVSTVTLLEGLHDIDPLPRVLVLSDRDDVERALEGLRAGARDLLFKPVSVDDAASSIQRLDAAAPATVTESPMPMRGQAMPHSLRLIGAAASISRIKQMIRRVAPFPATVLIEGETGTGKELVARLLHRQSGRKGRFVPVNCGAIAPELMESELFGHTRGAFTSAHQVREGLFMAAKGGTVFLDEISELPVGLQVKLLRALEEGNVRPVGSDREVAVDARVVASTQHDLPAEIKRGRFREDLFHRINVVHLQLPPLRERRDDIPELVDHFMAEIAADLAMAAVPLDAAGLRALQAREWTGNVRQLRNVVERTVLLGELPPELVAVTDEPRALDGSGPYPLDWTLEQVKQHHMERVLAASAGNKSEAARRLGISRKTLERKLGSGGD
ncbi:MAG: sigma-54 dependent transcriptional regulator [Gammaproteobacteria bacterium]